MTLLACEERLAAHCLRRHIRASEFFRDFDKLKLGHVTAAQFRRCLSMLGLYLTDDEAAALEHKYAHPENAALVLYDRFVQTLEAAPQTTVLAVSEHALRPLSETQHAAAERVLARLASVVSTRRLHAKTFFADYDKLHRGQCTVGQFRRGLKTGFGLPEEDIEALVAKYSLSEGVEVYYAQLHNDLEALTGNATEETSPSSSSSSSFPSHAAAVGERGLKSPSHAAHVVDPEERLRAYASLHRIRFSEFLRDYDKLRLGKVPYATFVAALGAIKLPRDRLSAEELTLLADRYAEDDVLDASKPHMTRRIVKWKAFCASVEGSSSSSSSSSEETATVGQCLSPTTRRALTISLADASSPQNGSHAQEGDGELGRVIHLVKERVRTRRILLKPVFVDFDRAGAGVYTTGRVSKERFRRAMATMGFVLTEAQYKALEQQYASPDGSEVMYALFVDDVDNVKEMVGQSAF